MPPPNEQIKSGIKKLLDEGKTQMEIAALCGVSPGNIYKYLYGSPTPDMETLAKFSKGLNIKFKELALFVKESSPVYAPKSQTARSIPILTSIQAGQWRDRSVPPVGAETEYIETDLRGERLFALRVTGNSMEPEFHEGDIITVNPDLQAQPNEYVVVKCPDHGSEEATLKQLKKINNVFFLHPLNPSYEDVLLTKRHKIVGKVVRRQKEY